MLLDITLTLELDEKEVLNVIETYADALSMLDDYDHGCLTKPDGMLMYGKEASNRKQEIDRQHYTIPNQRPKDKHCGKI